MTASEENHQGFLAFENTIAVEFLAFHLDNPLVYELLVRFSRQVKQAGFNRYSMDAIYHRVRWHMTFEVASKPTEFKLNNDFTSRYARLIMQQEPDLEDFFEVRVLRSA